MHNSNLTWVVPVIIILVTVALVYISVTTQGFDIASYSIVGIGIIAIILIVTSRKQSAD